MVRSAHGRVAAPPQPTAGRPSGGRPSRVPYPRNPNPFRSLIYLIGIVAVVLLYLLVATYVLGPIAVHRNTTSPVRMTFVRVEPREVPPNALAYLEPIGGALEEHGFRPRGYFHVPEAKADCLLLMHPSGETATVSTTHGQHWIDLTTELDSGQWLNVSNAAMPGVYLAHPDYLSLRFPQEADPVRLLALSRAGIRQAREQGANVRRPPPVPDERLLGDATERSVRWQEELGMYRRDGDVVRPTWKGAFLMSWKLLSPFRQVRQAHGLRKAKRLERELAPVEAPRREASAPAEKA